MTGQRVGMNWASLDIAISKHQDFELRPQEEKNEVFRNIQAMETAAIIELRKQERERKAND